MIKKQQCKNRFVFSTELNIAYLCIKSGKHKGRHHFVWQRYAKSGRILETRDFYAGEPKKYNPTYKTARWDIKVSIKN